MKTHTLIPKRQNGFTIIELMIATVTFSLVLIMCTAGIVQIGRLYYKGLISQRTQEAARSITDEISQSIQLNGGKITPTVAGGKIFCIGDQRYSYRLGVQVDGGTTHAFVLENKTCAVNDNTADDIVHASYAPTSPYRTFVPSKMRLANLVVRDIGLGNDLYEVKVRIVYGDNDLLCSAAVSGSCTNNTPLTNAQILANRDLACKSQRTGGQFCAFSELSTTVQKRIK